MNLFFGFIISAIILFGIIVLSILWSMYIISGDELNITNIVSAIGSIAGGFASIIAALAAYLALNTWAKQLTVGKKLQLVWDTMIDLRRLRTEKNRWHVAFFGFHNHKKEALDRETLWEKLEVNAANQSIQSAFKNLTINTVSLDVIVTKKGFLWKQKTNDLEMRFTDIKEYIKENSEKLNNPDTNTELARLNTEFEDITEAFEKDLIELENSLLKIEWRF